MKKYLKYSLLPNPNPKADTSTALCSLSFDDYVFSITSEYITAPLQLLANKGYKLLLLIDNKGSMGAFEKMTDAIVQEASQVFGGYSRIYYFYNLPQDFVYTNKYHCNHVGLEQLLTDIDAKTVVIVISDCGASRGGNSNDRFKSSLKFIVKLQSLAHKVVFFNPMPSYRWAGTTAERISKFVDMYGLSNVSESGLSEFTKPIDSTKSATSVENRVESRIAFFLKKASSHERDAYQHFMRVVAQLPMFSIDLLYAMLANFKSYGAGIATPSYLVVSDLVLSSLCRPIGVGLYKIEDDTRQHLLETSSNESNCYIAHLVENYIKNNLTSLSTAEYEAYKYWCISVLYPQDLAQYTYEDLRKRQSDLQGLNILWRYADLVTDNDFELSVSIVDELDDSGNVIEVHSIPNSLLKIIK